jgi:SH3 domain-containing YSC84-like protein 1
MWLAGSGGSGVVIARLPDGSWSSPGAFSVHTGGFGLVYGVDVYDCVCILNTDIAVEMYTKKELELGVGASMAAGPLGGTADVKDVKHVWTYTKSKGLYGGLTVDGTSIREKQEVNADFYGQSVSMEQILKGQVPAKGKSAGADRFQAMVEAAAGRQADKKLLQGISTEPTPGDMTQ